MSNDNGTMKFEISVGANRNVKNWKGKEVAWDFMLKECGIVRRTSEPFAQYLKMPPAMQGEIKDVGAFVGGKLTGGSRKKHAVLYRQLVTLDLDSADKMFWEDYKMIYGGVTSLVYSTHKHTKENPRLRLVMLLDRPVSAAEYEPICRRIADSIGIHQVDHTTYDVNRLMYWPSASIDGDVFFDHEEGEPLCADNILASYEDWRDTSEWPVGESETKDLNHRIKLKGDPVDILGIAGEFCRTYDVPAAIEKFLSDAYDPTDDDNRFTFKEGTTSAGLVIYENGKFGYSNHGSDPSTGKLCNAFDLVRIHKFDHLDKNSKEDTPFNRLPSQIAMSDYAAKDPNVRRLQDVERLEKAGTDFAENLEDPEVLDWMANLDRDRKGNYLALPNNTELIIEFDPRLKDKIKFNEFSYQTDVLGVVPWDVRTILRGWEDRDLSGLRSYIGKEPYLIKGADTIKDSFRLISFKKRYHPVKDYLLSVSWDGTARVDTLLIDYLGAADTQLNREFIRKTLVGAVKRIIRPGCKHDYVLTLIGKEGLKKSTLFKKLGKRWFSDTFNFNMLSGGNGVRAIEQIQNKWIIEIPEMSGLKKTDVDAAKSFITSRSDYYRASHQENMSDRARQCIFIGTSNNHDFLVGQTGARRFWPVDVYVNQPTKEVGVEDDEGLLPEEIDQIWAEAVHLYHAGEKNYLSDEMENLAKAEQTGHTEQDERAGVIEKYLNMMLPDKWAEMDLFARRAYFDFGDSENPGIYQRDRVCVAEIWVEALQGYQKDMGVHNTRWIHNIMRNMPGWEPYKSMTIFKGFGNQKGYKRTVAAVKHYNGTTNDTNIKNYHKKALC